MPMTSHIRVYAVVLAPFMVSAGVAGAVLLARTFLRRRLRSTVLLFSEARLYEMFDLLLRSATGGSSALLKHEEGNHVSVTLNWNNGEVLRVPALLFDDGHLNMIGLFEVYSGLLRYNYPNKLLLCDAWNCLIAILSYKLGRQLKEDAILLLDETQAEGILALCKLLRGKYAIITTLSSSWDNSLVVQDFPEKDFQLFLNAYHKKKSVRLGLVSFLRLVYESCSVQQLIILSSVLLVSPDLILKACVGWHTDVNWIPLYITEIGKTLDSNLVSSGCSLFSFIKEQCKGAPGALAAFAVTSVGPIELLYCIRNFLIQYILMDLVMSFHIRSYLALATADYTSDNNWTLSQSVSSALWHASSSVMGELQNQVPCLLETLYSCWVFIRFPVMTCCMWIGTQWSDFVGFLNESLYLESQYTKSFFRSPHVAPDHHHENYGDGSNDSERGDNNNSYSNSRCIVYGEHLNAPSPIYLLMEKNDYLWSNKSSSDSIISSTPQSQIVGQTLRERGISGQHQQQHHGLALLLLISLESDVISKTPWAYVASHTTWPVAPTVFLEYSVHILEGTPRSDNQVIDLERPHWVKMVKKKILSMDEVSCASRNATTFYRAEYYQGFGAFRRSGLELGAAKAVANVSCGTRNDRWEGFVRDILSGIFRTANAMPLLLASLVSLCTSQEYLERDTLERNNVMSHLEFIRHMFSLFPTFADIFYEEHGLSEAQVNLACAQRQLMLSGSSLGCYQVLEELQSVQHRIDRPVTNPTPPMEGPWSIEFKDVSFRYDESRPYILWRVSFRIEKGSFLGIVGYSGAGKTTLLRLLNRTYAPTSGEIWINGRDIRHYPARMFRRRIGNVWQEETNLRLFDHLSIADNVAFGNLQSSSVTNIYSALSAAKALSFVQKRSSNIYAPLRTHEFSGGEVERLCIARALMREHTEVCLYAFDEATSAVDSGTEQMIFHHLELNRKTTIPREATFVVISHRLATLKMADIILVLNNGRVAQLGSWDELCRSESDSCFSRLMRSQHLPLFDP